LYYLYFEQFPKSQSILFERVHFQALLGFAVGVGRVDAFWMNDRVIWLAGCPVMDFPALAELGGWVRQGFSLRVPGVEVRVDREAALGRLRDCHEAVARELGFRREQLALAEQVHGAEVGWVGGEWDGEVVGGVDGLATGVAGRVLGIHVADCCAVYVVDPVRRVVALMHSGRKGSELGVVRRGIECLEERAGSRPADLVVQLSPCIRPPHYEVDFAEWIRREAMACGVPAGQIHDDGVCTASDRERFYSYRAEKGKTGRMFALLGVADRDGGQGERAEDGSGLEGGFSGSTPGVG
jgi:copper oxidase (laccase) domain-containing protein